jgi:RNA polymerase sigma-70 factor
MAAGAGGYGLGYEEVAAVLYGVVGRHLPQASWSDDLAREFLARLNARDLVLARACASGSEAAWTDFMAEYRPFLERCALHLAARFDWSQDAADDLVDVAWADLYGVERARGQRGSKLASYAGTGPLKGWLRAVLYQIAVDYHRARRFHVPLQDGLERIPAPPARDEPVDDRCAAAGREALERALSSLDSDGKLLLASYYLDGMTLKQIGEVLGVHEATASRRLLRARDQVRKAVERSLRRDYGFGRERVAECVAAGEVGQVDLRSLLTAPRA